MLPIAAALAQNLALLVALAAGYQAFLGGWARDSLGRRLVAGLVVGAVAVAGMLVPFRFAPGLVYDGRSVVLAVAGLFGGPLVATVAAAVAAAFRLWMGGVGAPVGVAVIAVSAALGVGFGRLRARGVPVTAGAWLWGLGFLVHGAMLGLQLGLPGGLGPEALRLVALPVLLVYPLATVLIARLLLGAEERVAARRALEESEAHWRGFFEDHYAPMLLVDPADGAIVGANPAATRYYGWPREELGAKRIQELNTLPPEAVQAEMAAAAAEVRNHFRFRHRRADGSVRDVEVYSGPARLGGRRLLCSLVVDVTERCRAEAARDAAEAAARELGALVEESRGEVYVFGGDTLRFVWANRSARENLGYTLEELLTRTPLDLKPDLTPEGFGALLAPLDDGREPLVRFTTRHRRKNGSLYPVDVAVQAVVHQGRPCYAAFIVDDSRRRELEAQLRQAQKMEAVGRLAGGVAHDFNNLLQVILGTSELLEARVAPTGPVRAGLDDIRRAAERAAGLTRQLLAYSRRQVLEPRVTDPNRLVAETERLLRRLIGEDIALEVRLAPDAGRVLVDPGQLQQVLLNLAVNARDAMPRGGTLTLETANLELDEAYTREHPGASPGPHVMIAVTDTGTGMDAATRERLFEPFFTTKETGKGTGLGLATAYGIVKQSGGSIYVYSEPGRGATFKVYLPRVDAAPGVVAGPAPAEPHPAAGVTVLLAEDDELVRASVGAMLRHVGYSVLEAEHGAAALAVARAHPGPIALLVTDVVMPGMGGPALAEALAAERPETKVLFVSGYTTNAIVHHGVLDPGVAFLQKPFTHRDLLAKIRQVLAG